VLALSWPQYNNTPSPPAPFQSTNRQPATQSSTHLCPMNESSRREGSALTICWISSATLLPHTSMPGCGFGWREVRGSWWWGIDLLRETACCMSLHFATCMQQHARHPCKACGQRMIKGAIPCGHIDAPSQLANAVFSAVACTSTLPALGCDASCCMNGCQSQSEPQMPCSSTIRCVGAASLVTSTGAIGRQERGNGGGYCSGSATAVGCCAGQQRC